MNADEIADQIFARIGCFDIAEWLGELAQTLGLEASELTPIPAVESKTIALERWGLTLTLHHPHAGYVQEGDPARWVLTDAEFDLNSADGVGWSNALPSGLDKHNSTPENIRAKWGEAAAGLTPAGIAAGDLRETYIWDDGRAIEITWSPSLLGIDRLHIARLGRHMPFRRHAEGDRTT